MEIDLRAVRLDRPLTGSEAAALLSLLPPERLKRLERVRQAEKREQVLCAYGLLYWILRERYGWAKFPRMDLAPYGKPYFPDHPSVCFSLSHTDGAVLAGVSPRFLGVDIEKLRPVSSRLRERLSPGESDESFFQSWVRREAFAKQTGTGLNQLPGSEQPGEGQFLLLPTFPGYIAGVACGDAVLDRVRLYRLEELVKACGGEAACPDGLR